MISGAVKLIHGRSAVKAEEVDILGQKMERTCLGEAAAMAAAPGWPVSMCWEAGEVSLAKCLGSSLFLISPSVPQSLQALSSLASHPLARTDSLQEAPLGFRDSKDHTQGLLDLS